MVPCGANRVRKVSSVMLLGICENGAKRKNKRWEVFRDRDWYSPEFQISHLSHLVESIMAFGPGEWLLVLKTFSVWQVMCHADSTFMANICLQNNDLEMMSCLAQGLQQHAEAMKIIEFQCLECCHLHMKTMWMCKERRHCGIPLLLTHGVQVEVFDSIASDYVVLQKFLCARHNHKHQYAGCHTDCKHWVCKPQMRSVQQGQWVTLIKTHPGLVFSQTHRTSHSITTTSLH